MTIANPTRVRVRISKALGRVVLTGAVLASAACTMQDSAETDAGQPRRGGTLRLVGQGDIDHFDTASALFGTSFLLERVYSRQLVTYPPSRDKAVASRLAADVASEVPTRDNGGVSADGLTYTFLIRPGVKWNSDPPRQVTSGDFVRGLQRVCNPVMGTGGLTILTDTIAGMKEFCDGFQKVAGTVGALREYIDSTPISGVTAPDDRTLRIRLRQPANDFLEIMALPRTSAAPREFLQQLPDSPEFRKNMLVNGPYRIVEHQPGARMVLERNPAWDKSSDPLRTAYVDRIEVSQGVATEAVQQQLEAGTADLPWDTPVPTAALTDRKGDSRLEIFPTAANNPFIVINLRSPNANGATAKLAVRQALNYAVNKVAIGQIFGGSDLATPQSQVLTPPIPGYRKFDLYPTPGDRGDPDKARQLLATAGYADGLTLKLLHRTGGIHPLVAQRVQADLARAGITAELLPIQPMDFVPVYLRDPAKAASGAWDIAITAWFPHWNGARDMLGHLTWSRSLAPNGGNFGGYSSPAVDALIEKALAAPDPNEAADLWHQADRTVMADAPLVPVQTTNQALFRSARVRNNIYSPFTARYELTEVWLGSG